MAARHPEVTVVIDHLGSPDYRDPDSLTNLLALSERPNVFVKLSGYPSGTRAAYPYSEAHTADRARLPRVWPPATHVGNRLACLPGQRDLQAGIRLGLESPLPQ